MHERISDEEWFAHNGWYANTAGASFNGEQLDEFRELITPLEQKSGKPLNGPGLRACQRAYKEQPDAFRRLAAEALERGQRNANGLLVHMVKERDHRLPAPSGEAADVDDAHGRAHVAVLVENVANALPDIEAA
jgi:hypothetical protein